MTDRLLRKKDIAERLCTSPGRAMAILAKYGCTPIDYGPGRSGGLRWLESAVSNVICTMHMEAQPTPKISKAKSSKTFDIPKMNLANAKAKDLHPVLTPDSPTQ